MSETASRLLATFDSLPPHEQHRVLTEMLRRSGEVPGTFLTDDNLVGLADDLFQALDAEESHGTNTGAK